MQNEMLGNLVEIFKSLGKFGIFCKVKVQRSKGLKKFRKDLLNIDFRF